MSKLIGCGCLICRKGKADLVSELKDTHSPKRIISKLESEYNLKITNQTLSRHLKNFDESALTPTVEDTLEPISGLLAISLNEVNFDRFNFNPEDGASIVNYLQRVHLNFYLTQMEVVNSELNQYKEGLTDLQPIQSINALQKFHAMLLDLTGIKNIVDVNIAIETLTKQGYEIRKKDVI